MSNLLEKHKYSLSNVEKKSKSVVFVKLTDSAVESIERFLSLKDDSSPKPSIQFENNTGVISLPMNDNKLNYGFTLSNIEGDKLQSSFQCLQHTNKNNLESLGFIFMKMQIHANEDSYEKTKSRVTAADQEQKNLCTKQLKQNVSRIGNKVNVKRPRLVYIPEKTQSSIVKPEPVKLNSKSEENSSDCLMQKPIRERIIHILAAKPYKKAELLLRLKREGISDTDKDKIASVLVEVAKLKGNIFTLENHIWNEVQDDWEFCSLAELQLIKKKKDQFLKTKNVNGITGSSKHCVKENGAVSTPEMPFNKKQRASHNGHQNGNFFQNDSSVTIGNGLKNGSVGISETHFNPKQNGLNPLSKQISSLFSRKSNLPVKKKNHSASNGTLRASKTSFCNNIPSLKSTFVLSEHRNEEQNGKGQEAMSVDVANDDNEIHQPQCRKQSFPATSVEMSVDVANDDNEIHQPQCRKQSLPVTSVEMSVCNQIENGVSQIQQSNNCLQTSIDESENSSLSVLNSKNLRKQLLNGASSLSHKSDDSSLNILSLKQSAPEFDFSEIQLKYTKVLSLEQRSQYIKDFNNEYEEYVDLNIQMKESSDKYSQMFENLETCVVDSPEFKRIEVQIKKEYKKTLKDNSYFTSRKRFDFLKAKLSHIREVILEYDKTVVADEE